MNTITFNAHKAVRYLRPFAPMAGPLAPAALEILDTVPRGLGARVSNLRLEEGWARVGKSLEVHSPDLPQRDQLQLAQYLNHMSSLPHRRPAYAQGTSQPIYSLNPGTQADLDLKTPPPAPFQGVLCHHDRDNPKDPFTASREAMGMQHLPLFPYVGIGPETKKESLTPGEMAQRIEKLGLPKGSPVLLFSCRAGLEGPHGEPSSAAQISRQTGRPIVAAAAWVQVKNQDYVQLWNDRDPQNCPKEWRIFYPDGRSAVLPGVNQH